MRFLKYLGFVVLLIVVTLFVLYIIAWMPVVDRVINPCKYYPDLLIDCKE